jgi:hypothetical protein
MDATKMEAGIRLFLEGLGERFTGTISKRLRVASPRRGSTTWSQDTPSTPPPS